MAFVLICLAPVGLSLAGSYNRVADCGPQDGCSAGTRFSDGEPVPPFAITHVPGYDGTPGASFQFRICVALGSESLSGPTQRAIDTWNALSPLTENCENCDVWETVPPGLPDVLHAESVLLHELGHCPLALDHPDRNWDGDADGVWENTSFTRSWGALAPTPGVPSSGGLQVGPDFIRGSPDDTQSAPGGRIAESVSFFRKLDNDPFIVDATVIDSTTYSRSTASRLPPGHTWAANANRRVGEEAFDVDNTQAVMYSLIAEGQRLLGLSADDVNMLKMAATGEDRLAGTADDYTTELLLSCEGQIDVLVRIGPVTDPLSVAAECSAPGIDLSFPQGVVEIHHTLLPDPQDGLFFVTLNDQITWDTGSLVFVDGFESGDTSEWDATFPAHEDSPPNR